jgi:hypothetical protein
MRLGKDGSFVKRGMQQVKTSNSDLIPAGIWLDFPGQLVLDPGTGNLESSIPTYHPILIYDESTMGTESDLNKKGYIQCKGQAINSTLYPSLSKLFNGYLPNYSVASKTETDYPPTDRFC